MNDTALLTSFFEIGTDLAARVGAARFRAVIDRSLSSPSVYICIAEPARDAVQFRLRFGSATVTDQGVVDHVPDDEAERRGAWVGSRPYAISVMALLKFMPPARVRALLESTSPGEWFQVDLERRRLIPVAEPESLAGFDRAGETLVRLKGDPNKISELLIQIREQTGSLGD